MSSAFLNGCLKAGTRGKKFAKCCSPSEESNLHKYPLQFLNLPSISWGQSLRCLLHSVHGNRKIFWYTTPLPSQKWCCVELAPEKQQLHAQQREERAALLAALEQLEAQYLKDLEKIRAQVRKKRFTQAISRARRYHEGIGFWEYVNNIVEDVHLFTWKKTAVATCTAEYQRKQYQLETELRDQLAQHRNERITLRYSLPSEA